MIAVMFACLVICLAGMVWAIFGGPWWLAVLFAAGVLASALGFVGSIAKARPW